MSALKIDVTALATKIKESRKQQGSVRKVDSELRMANMDASIAQKEKLDDWNIAYDSRPASEGGLSMLKASELIEEEIKSRKARREEARAKPASETQITTLVNKFGAEYEDVKDLNQGQASDLMRQLVGPKKK